MTLLDLSSNRLARTAAAALAPLEDLTWLSLNNNPRLRDLCAAAGEYVTLNRSGHSSFLNGDQNRRYSLAGTSPFNKSTKLSYLYLQNTSINHICSDWRDNMTHLKILDLRGTNVSELRVSQH